MIRRRQFLKLSMLSVCTPAFLGLNATVKAAALATARRDHLWPGAELAVGYWEGSERLTFLDPNLEEGEALSLAIEDVHVGNVEMDGRISPYVIAADELRVGDPLLIKHGVRLTIHGLIGADREWSADAPRALNLFVTMNTLAEPYRWHAWGIQRSPVLNAGSALSAVVPIQPDGLELVVELVSGSHLDPGSGRQADTRKEVPIHLAIDHDPYRLKLRRGVYFIGVSEQAKQSPLSWDRCRLTAAANEDQCVNKVTLGVEPQWSFVARTYHKYLVFSVDYADQG
ncbi:MAG: hypothetical protein ACE5LB_04035 [Acidiferrobacterales bacterium]